MRIFYKILLFGLLAAFAPLLVIGILAKAFEGSYLRNKALRLSASASSGNLQVGFDLNSGVVNKSAPSLNISNVYASQLITSQIAPLSEARFVKAQAEHYFYLGNCRAISPTEGLCVLAARGNLTDGVTRFVDQLLYAITGLGILVVVGAFWIAGTIVRPLEQLAAHLVTRRDDDRFDYKGFADDEVGMLAGQIDTYLQTVRKARELEAGATREKALALLAAQVAHDIRSPLSALQIVMDVSEEMPEDTRLLMRTAITRITDISNTLLERQRDEAPTIEARGEETVLLSSLIESVVTEKRARYRNLQDITVDAVFGVESYGIFARISPVELKRVVSNLIDNAVDALETKGAVRIGLRPFASSALITIEDNGKGIAPDILPLLMEKGASFGKAQGNGLGLFHARQSLEGAGGKIQITSEVGRGTCIQVVLPQETPPAWFVSEIDLGSNKRIVVVDDDQSVHRVWKARCPGDFEIRSFACPRDFGRWWIGSEENERAEALVLMDYEFSGEEKNGLNVIEELKIASKSVLVTSRYEENDISGTCERMSIRLLPKNLAPYIPIRLGT